MKKLLCISGLSVLIIFIGLMIWRVRKPKFLSPLPSSFNFYKTNYTPYSFEYLQRREYFKSEVKLEKVLGKETTFTSYLFSYASDGRRITGMANFPKKKGKLPVAILLRGWVDEERYQTGMGSKKMAEFLAENGFLTLAPDFLGYGESDSAFSDMLETRFFRPITVISLLESLESLPQADLDKIVFWGHSNGGQIALSVLEITGKNIPTSLWAPVSAPFPESVLHYTDELEDGGEMLRKVISEFEKEYDPLQYSIISYFNQIKAPLIIHQGTDDEAVPLEWSEDLVNQLNNLGIKVAYYKYPEEDHNFTRGSASKARARDLEFFRKNLSIRLDKKF